MTPRNVLLLFVLLNVATLPTSGQALSAAEAGKLMAEVSRIRNVQLSPDGSLLVYSIVRKSVTTNRETSDLLLQRLPQNSEPLPQAISLPNGASEVRWCPDSKCLSMIVGRDTQNPQTTAALMRFDVATKNLTPVPLQDPAAGTEASTNRPRITTVGTDYQWSPQGNYLAFTAPLLPVGGVDSRRGVPARLATAKTRRALFALDVANGLVTQLSPDSLHATSFSWAPDESALAVAVRTDPDGFGPDFRTDLIIIDRKTRNTRDLVIRPGIDASPKWSPDGRWIAFVTHGGELSYNNCWPAVISPTGGPIISFKSVDTPKTRSISLWTPDSSAFFYTSGLDMTQRFVRAEVGSRSATPLPAPKGELPYDENYSISADSRSLAYTRESLTTPPELYIVALESQGRPAGEPRKLTNLTNNFRLSALVQTETLNWPSPDGKFTIHALLLKPTTSRSNGPLPTLLYFYGGPSMVRRGFGAEGFNGALLALAARGYVVLVPNTRGRGGQGEAFERGIRDGKSNAGLPYRDAMVGLDLLVKRGIADASKLGVLGHSYGGFLTEYTITQTQRFKGAVVHEGHVVDMVSPRYLLFELGSDNELLARDLYGVHNPFDPAERARLMAESPGYNVDRVKTPTLLQFGAKSGVADSVGQKFFNGLRRFNVPSAFFLYDEGHVFQRPAAIADDITRTAEWLDFWVRGIPYPDKERAKEYEEWQSSTESQIRSQSVPR